MTDIVNPPCNMADAEPVDLEAALQASLDAQQGKALCPWLLSATHDERTCSVCAPRRRPSRSRCDACKEDDHGECQQPVKSAGDRRGDNFIVIRCCCGRGN